MRLLHHLVHAFNAVSFQDVPDFYKMTYKVFDLKGKELIGGNFTSMKEDISLENFSEGMYLLFIQKGGLIYSEKIIKR